jgi:3-hydroxyacyl-CoA dehydrogenase
MKYEIHRAVVIGAGTMGAAIAAHLANAGVRVNLLDVVPNQLTTEEQKQGLLLTDPQVRNRLARDGLNRALQSRPASFFTPDIARLVQIGNLEDDLGVIGQAGWVIEAIVENLEIKRHLMARIAALRQPHTIISTNTSGIPIASIAQGLPDDFRAHFLGTHFFNPPRYLKLVELIPTPDTLPGVTASMSRFISNRLGKGVVMAKDTPNFIGNRIAFGEAAFALDYILSNGYTVEEVDAITGPVIGRPKTATFRLIDLVGVDIWEHVGRNLAPMIPHDTHALRYLNAERSNQLIHTMVERGWLGGKTKQGFYKEVRQADGSKEFWVLDLATLEYAPPAKARFDSIGIAKDKPLAERLKILLAADDRAGQLVRALTYQSLAYASERVPEIADTPRPIDEAMCWGFGLEAGPFERWDMIGVDECVAAMKSAGFPPAPWVEVMLAKGFSTFYQYQHGLKIGVYHPGKCAYETIPHSSMLITFNDLKISGKLIKKNDGASLVDLGDGIAGVELHTKMNVLDADIFQMMIEALDRCEREFDGLVISTAAENFCAGANLFMIALAAQNQLWDQLETMVRQMQDTNMRMRYFHKPVVIAPAGLALGGGSEVLMHAGRVVAGAELYAGLVEIGMGLIPAGGGTKEMLRRVLTPPMLTKNTEALPFLQRIFEQVGLAKVSTSAEEARQLGILGPCDRVVMNREILLAEAKEEALRLAASGYRPPYPEMIYAAGRDALAALRVGIYMMKEASYITEYEAHIAGKLAYVMTGGELSSPAWVSEQYILDLEREAFLALCGEAKTMERIWTFLQSGKRIRN